MTADELARHFRMQPHPEGGFYVETYRSQRRIPTDALPAGWGEHSWSTGILFLLRQGECSHLHRIRQDEMWHFYLGGALRLAVIVPDVSASEPLLGQDVLAGHTVQCTVPAGSWFGASPWRERPLPWSAARWRQASNSPTSCSARATGSCPASPAQGSR